MNEFVYANGAVKWGQPGPLGRNNCNISRMGGILGTRGLEGADRSMTDTTRCRLHRGLDPARSLRRLVHKPSSSSLHK